MRWFLILSVFHLKALDGVTLPLATKTLPALAASSRQFHSSFAEIRYLLVSHDQERQERKWSFDWSDACRSLCDDFLDAAARGATCECPNSKAPLVICTLPLSCQPVQNCARHVCAEYTIQGELNVDKDAGRVYLESVEMWTTYRHAAYDGEGTFGNGKTCRQWFILDGLVYECLSCSVCSEGGIHLDCSNIQPNAVLNQCSESEAADLFSVFDYCPLGGAPEPLTPGSASGEEKANSQAFVLWDAMVPVGLPCLLLYWMSDRLWW